MRKLHSTIGRGGLPEGEIFERRMALTPPLGVPKVVARRRISDGVPVADYGSSHGALGADQHACAQVASDQAAADAVPEAVDDCVADTVRVPLPVNSRVGAKIGAYRILREIGRGGMGAVYFAEHELIGRKAAIKVLLPQYSKNADFVERFFNEARSTAMIRHPGLVDVVDYGHDTDGTAYLVMEFLDGESLTSHLERNKEVSAEFTLGVARQIAGALGAAHSKAIVHRDLKPDNIFLVPDPEMAIGYRVKILDFGIAKLMSGGSNIRHTDANAILGTPAYMSPEQCRGAAGVDHRSDIYSLGCIVFRMMCGRRPFLGSTAELLAQHVQTLPPRPSTINPGIDSLTEGWILEMMDKDASARYQTMAEVVSSLDAITGGSSRSQSGRRTSSASMATTSQENLITLPPVEHVPSPPGPAVDPSPALADKPSVVTSTPAPQPPANDADPTEAEAFETPLGNIRRFFARAVASLLVLAAASLFAHELLSSNSPSSAEMALASHTTPQPPITP